VLSVLSPGSAGTVEIIVLAGMGVVSGKHAQRLGVDASNLSERALPDRQRAVW
jgi:hypothetical protein